MERLLEIMRRLRKDCPWDREQTHQSLQPYLLEEASEAVDALIDGNNSEIISELGDVLLQIAFHSVIAEENNEYNYEKIENSIVEKLIRRHPHVFSVQNDLTTEEVAEQWQKIKAKEGQKQNVPNSLPALMRAQKFAKLKNQTINKEKLLEIIKNSSEDSDGLGNILQAVALFAENLKLDAEITLRNHLIKME